jgi:hypothetical protein
MKQLSGSDIRVGEPLPFSVYDKDGRLLLRHGVVIAFEEQIERLIENGLFSGGGSVSTGALSGRREELPPVFDEIGSLTLRLKTAFTALSGASVIDEAAERVMILAREIHAVCARDAEAAIAAVHLDFHNPYLLSHHVHSAVLCSLLGRRLSVPDEELMPVLGAALTYDIGLVDMPHLEKQREPLSEEQSGFVRRHPQKSAEILRRAGVEDERWISAVQDHHERLNGGGYPRGLSGEGLALGTRMLGLADSYLAMVKSRPFREARVPLKAVGEIYVGREGNFGATLCDALVRELGMYPPGAIVRLANGEVAVVKARGEKNTQPQVFSVYDASGMPFMSPRERDSRLEECAVKEPVAHAECRAVALIMRRLWTKQIKRQGKSDETECSGYSA